MESTPQAEPGPSDQGNVDALMETLRSILLDQERARLQDLEVRLRQLRDQAQERDLAAAVVQLQDDVQPAVMAGHLTPEMSNLIRRTIHESHDEMAEAIGPVMGEAIRVQIRDSRRDMVEALYPVIGETVQRSIAEFAREFQRNIDSRLKSTGAPARRFRC